MKTMHKQAALLKSRELVSMQIQAEYKLTEQPSKVPRLKSVPLNQ